MSLQSFAYPEWMFPFVFWAFGLTLLGLVVINALRPKYRRLYGGSSILISLRNTLLTAIPVHIYMWIMLIVVWTPVWWLAVLMNGVTGIGTATEWFLTAVMLFYSWWLVRGLNGFSINRELAALAASDAAPPAIRKRVAVVGAGMAGLVAAKELKEEGHDVVVFERTSGPGGVWASSKAKGGVAWGRTMTSTGAMNSTLSDSVSQVFHPEHEKWPRHFNRDQFHGVLTDYEARHGVFADTLQCETEVLGMAALPGDRWQLSVRDHTTGETRDEAFDAVTICTGLNKEAYTPEFAGQDRFRGKQSHVEAYRPSDATQYAGKRVLVVGLGETSSDLVKDLVDHGVAHVFVSQRGGTFVIPRDVANLPPDHVETRLNHDGPMFHRFAMIMLGVAPASLFPALSRYRIPPNIFRHFWQITVLNHPNKLGLWRMGSLNWTKSDSIYEAIQAGRATVLRDIKRLTEGSVVFENGVEEKIDAIIYATGYRPGGSLLPQMSGTDAPLPQSARDLYKLTIPPHHPNVAVIGYARGQIGAITVSSEMQARWWALLVSGKRSLPPSDDMARFADELRHKGRRFHQPNRTTGTFAYSLARDEIGCEPDMFNLFVTDLRLWFAVFLGPICSAHFRLRGHGARPDLAKEQLFMRHGIQCEDYVDSVDIYANTLPLATFLVPALGAWSRILPGFFFRNATRSYI